MASDGPTSIRHFSRRRLAVAWTFFLAAAGLVLTGAGPASAASGGNSISVGLPPTAVAIDHAAHTAYVAVSDGVTSQVAIVDTARCTARPSAHCTGAATAITLPGNPGPAALAYDSVNHTVYVADASTGNVSLINATTCNATHLSGCATAPKVATLGLTAPGAITVDTAGKFNAVYVADEGSNTVTVLNGKTCKATTTHGCSSVRTAIVGAAPSAIAVDHSVGTVYVANLAGDSVSMLREPACSKLASSCKFHARRVSLGAGTQPLALLADRATKTVYIADSGTGAISFLNTAKCSMSKKAGCAKTPRRQSGITDPEGLALMSSGRIAVADAGDDAVLVFGAARCSATKTSGCLKVDVHLLGGSPVAVASIGSRVYAADPSLSSLDAIAVAS
jgi:DNA-binding beta-propeller fold protein YncE